MSHAASIAAAAAGLPVDTMISVLTAHDRPPTGPSRIGGPGVELGARHPTFVNGGRMTHIVTLATAEVPTLAEAYPDAAAVALYVFEPRSNEAFEPFARDAAVVALSWEELAGPPAASTREDLPPRAVTVEHLAVPAAAFGDSEGAALEAVRAAIFAAPGRAGGAPIWVQAPQHTGTFLFQFDEQLADLNLGDAGVMYVFVDTAFWQGH